MKQISLNSTIAFLEAQVVNHGIYVWGAQGQQGSQITEAWIRRREQDTGGTRVNGQYVTYADLAVSHWKEACAEGYGDILRAFDCSGLFMYWLIKEGVFERDHTANGIYSYCSETTEAKQGYMVFRVNRDTNRATHVGMLVSDTEVIHCKGRREGCVKETFSPTYWTTIAVPPWFDFEAEPVETQTYVRTKGRVRVREGNGTSYKQIKPTATKKDYLPYLGQATEEPYWYLVEWQGQEGYITSNNRYTEVVQK